MGKSPIIRSMVKRIKLYGKCKTLMDAERHMIFGGWLAEYKYYDMDQIVAAALETISQETEKV